MRILLVGSPHFLVGSNGLRRRGLRLSQARKVFSLQNEKPMEDKNGVRREILQYPWDDVAYYILKYISCEGRLSIVYAYMFSFLY